MKQTFCDYITQDIESIVTMFINSVACDFDDLKYSSYNYYYLDYTSLDTITIDIDNFIIVPFDDHPAPVIILLEIDKDDILNLSDQPFTYRDAVRKVLLDTIERTLK